MDRNVSFQPTQPITISQPHEPSGFHHRHSSAALLLHCRAQEKLHSSWRTRTNEGGFKGPTLQETVWFVLQQQELSFRYSCFYFFLFFLQNWSYLSWSSIMCNLHVFPLNGKKKSWNACKILQNKTLSFGDQGMKNIFAFVGLFAVKNRNSFLFDYCWKWFFPLRRCTDPPIDLTLQLLPNQEQDPGTIKLLPFGWTNSFFLVGNHGLGFRGADFYSDHLKKYLGCLKVAQLTLEVLIP